MPAVPSLQNTRVSFLEKELYYKRGWTINAQTQFIEQVNFITDTKQTFWYCAWDFVNLFEELMQTADGRGASSVAKQENRCVTDISFFIKSSVSKPYNSLYSTLVQIQKHLLGIFCCLTNGYPSLLILLDLSAA